MASKLIRCFTVLSIALAWCLAALPTPAHAASPADAAVVKLHHFKFYLDPALVPDLAFAQAVLPQYVSDMNVILVKNTDRQLVFDPATDIILTSSKPQTDSSSGVLPSEGFEIWAYAVQSTTPYSYGGYGSMDMSGAGVVAGLRWARIYDPDNLASDQVADYRSQVSIMLHEMAHMFGAGIGEYYSLTYIADTTQTEPLLNISLYGGADPYWSDKPDFMTDPLLSVTPAATRADYLAKAQYSRLTSTIISGDFRNGVPSFDHFTIQVLDQAAQPVPGAQVKVWSVVARSPYTSTLLFDGPADENGQALLPWGGLGSPHNVNNLLRLIKVYKDGLPIAEPRYVSVFDSDIAQFVDGQSSFVVVMRPPDQPPTDLSLTNAALDENQPAGAWVGDLAAVDPDAGDAMSFSFCGGADDGSFQVAGSSLLSSLPFDYELKSSYSICLQTNDGRGGTLQRSFDIQVNDLPDTNEAAVTSEAAADGWVLESGTGTNRGGPVNVRSNTLLLGNDVAGRHYRSLLTFDTSTLPADAIITKVTLKIRKQSVVGGDPFAVLGGLVADIGSPFIGATPAVQSADFGARASQGSAAAFTRKPDSGGWYSAVLKIQGMSLINLTGTTQFRLRFSGTAAIAGDYLSIYSGNAAPANRPVLVVEYELPQGTLTSDQ